MYRNNNWIKRNTLQIKSKEETEKKRLLKIQQPTAEATKEQVSVEVDNQLPQKVCESASKKLLHLIDAYLSIRTCLILFKIHELENKKRKRKG